MRVDEDIGPDKRVQHQLSKFLKRVQPVMVIICTGTELYLLNKQHKNLVCNKSTVPGVIIKTLIIKN